MFILKFSSVVVINALKITTRVDVLIDVDVIEMNRFENRVVLCRRGLYLFRISAQDALLVFWKIFQLTKTLNPFVVQVQDQPAAGGCDDLLL